jgi:adenylate kinase
LVFLGAPGAGKGTQARELGIKLSIPQISTGDMLRAAVAAQTPAGILAKSAMDSGNLVSDEIICALIKDRLEESDAQNGFILDGFPRNESQAVVLDQLLSDIKMPLDAVVDLVVEDKILLPRLTGRRVCKSCGASYHLLFNPSPKGEDTCGHCGGELYQRKDDNEATVASRLEVYHRETAPISSYYQAKNLLKTLNGDQALEAVQGDLFAALGIK